jgi:hypothetical protein
LCIVLKVVLENVIVVINWVEANMVLKEKKIFTANVMGP